MAWYRSRPGGLILPKYVPRGEIIVDFSHPLASGLVSAYVPGSPSGFQDYGPAAVAIVPDIAATITASLIGPGQLSTGNNQGAYLTTPLTQQLAAPLSIFWFGEARGAAAGNSVNFGVTQTTDSAPFIAYSLSTDASLNSAFFTNNAGTFLNPGSSTPAPSSGFFSQAGSMSATTILGYLNGKLITNASGSYTGPSYAAGFTTGLGGQVAYKTSRSPNVVSGCGYIFNRILSAAEIAWLDAEPFAFFVPKIRRTYSIPAASVSPALDFGQTPAMFVPGNGPAGIGNFIRARNLPRTDRVVVLTPTGAAPPSMFTPGNGPAGLGSFIRAKNAAHTPPVVTLTPVGAAPPAMFVPGNGPAGLGKFIQAKNTAHEQFIPVVTEVGSPPPSMFHPARNPAGIGNFIRARNLPHEPFVPVVTEAGSARPNVYQPGIGPAGFGLFTRVEPAQEPPAAGPGTVTGTGAFTDPVETVSATGAVAATGAGALADPIETVAATGAVSIVGAGAANDPVETIAATGAVAATGAGALADPIETLAGTGAVDVAGTGAFTDPVETLSGSGAVAISGAGGFTDPAETVSGAGTVDVVGSGAIADPVETASGTATVVDAAQAGASAPNLFRPGFGPAGFGQFFRVARAMLGPDASAVGAFVDPVETVSGTATVLVTGAGAFTDPTETLAGTAAVAITGTGALADAVETVSGTGFITVTGTGAVADPVETVGGTSVSPTVAGAARPNMFRPGFGPGGFGNFQRRVLPREISLGPRGIGLIVDPVETVAGVGTISVFGAGAMIDPVETTSSLAIMSGDLIHGAFVDPVETLLGIGTVTGIGTVRGTTAALPDALLAPPRLIGDPQTDNVAMYRWLFQLHDHLVKRNNALGQLEALVSQVQKQEGEGTIIASLFLDMLSEVRLLRTIVEAMRNNA